MEYFSCPLNSLPPSAPVGSIESEWDKLDTALADPNEEEIRKYIKQFRNHKAGGYDDITGEMLESDGKKLKK